MQAQHGVLFSVDVPAAIISVIEVTWVLLKVTHQ